MIPFASFVAMISDGPVGSRGRTRRASGLCGSEMAQGTGEHAPAHITLQAEEAMGAAAREPIVAAQAVDTPFDPRAPANTSDSAGANSAGVHWRAARR
jgi:hypothetical protein